MKATFVRISIILLFYDGVTTLIIPEEVPTILSLIYSNIPPIKKGTDSRLGVGFRLGEHADFQILVELGPQKETEPIGNTDAKRRRMATYGAAMRGELGPWAQTVAEYQTQLRIQKELERMKHLEVKLANLKYENGEKLDRKKASSSDWLTKWSNSKVPSDEKSSSTISMPVESIVLNVKNDRRGESKMRQNLDTKITDLQKLLYQQPMS